MSLLPPGGSEGAASALLFSSEVSAERSLGLSSATSSASESVTAKTSRLCLRIGKGKGLLALLMRKPVMRSGVVLGFA